MNGKRFFVGYKYRCLLLLLIITLALAAIIISACESKIKSVIASQSTDILVVSENDFKENSNKIYKNNAEFTEKFAKCATQEIFEGQYYYAVYIFNITYSDIEYSPECYDTSTFITSEAITDVSFVCDNGTVEFKYDNGANCKSISYSPEKVEKKISGYIAMRFTTSFDGELEVNAQIYGYYIDAYKTLISDKNSNISRASYSMRAYFKKQINLDNYEVNYYNAMPGPNGADESTKLTSYEDIPQYDKLYIVLDCVLKETDCDENDKLELSFVYTPSSRVTGNLEDANSGNYSQTSNNLKKTLTVTYSMPDKAIGSKKIHIVYSVSFSANGQIGLRINAKGVSDGNNISVMNGADSYIIADNAYYQPKSVGYSYAEDLNYRLGDDGYIVTGLKTDITNTQIIIPEYYDGRLVTSIDDGAFMGTEITGITLPDSITTIGELAFSNCESLIKVVMPNDLTAISYQTFLGCTSLSEIVLPENLTFIGESAFEGCSSLQSISIGAKVTDIRTKAFRNCINLKSINVDENNKMYTSVDGNLFYVGKKTLLQYAIGKDESDIIIPDYVTQIGESAFYGCTKINTLTIPENVSYIGENAFVNCTQITQINFNAINCAVSYHATYSKYGVFANAGKDSGAIKVIFGKNVLSVPAYLFYSNYSNGLNGETDYAEVTTVEFEEGSVCEEIGERAFMSCRKLTKIDLPEGITFVGVGAFANCERISYTKIDDSSYLGNESNPYLVLIYASSKIENYVSDSRVKVIYNTAFYYNNKLVEATLTENVTGISGNAFYNCYKLKSVTILNKAIKIGNSAFVDCDELEYIYYAGSVADLGSKNINKNLLYYYSDVEPDDNGQYWHYDDDMLPVIWGKDD